MKDQDPNSQTPLSFEQAYTRLEAILEALNGGKISLEDSLSLYEEAHHLIASCNQKLGHAEKKIEILIKNRSGELIVDSQGLPIKEDFR